MQINSVQALIAFIKSPLPGKVKTRLAAGIGEQQALICYQKMLEHLQNTLLTVSAIKKVYGTGKHGAEEWSPFHFTYHVQQGADIGERMGNAMESSFAEGAEKVVLVGGDCPGVYPALFDRAFQLLATHDLVLGPAFDGGYYLIGLRRPSPKLFEGIAWSTETVLSQTLHKASALGLRYTLVDRLHDVDTVEDLQHYPWLLKG